MGLDGIGTFAPKDLDVQVLLYPLKEQLDLPTIFVQQCYLLGPDLKIVGQKHQRDSVFFVIIFDPTQIFWVGQCCLVVRQADRLIAAQASGFIDPARVHAHERQVLLGADDEKRARLMDLAQTCPIQVAPIHHIEGFAFKRQDVQHVHIVPQTIRNMHETRNLTANIEQGVQLHRRFVLAELRPPKDLQAQINRGGIQGVDSVVHFEPLQVSARIQTPSPLNQPFGNVCVDAPITSFVRIGQRRTAYPMAQTKVV